MTLLGLLTRKEAATVDDPSCSMVVRSKLRLSTTENRLCRAGRGPQWRLLVIGHDS